MILRLRRASEADIEITFAWVNNEIVRKFSVNKKKISFNSHRDWFTKRINSKETAYYILEEIDGEALGSIRFDIDDDEARINYLIDPKRHGIGLGKFIVKQGIDAIKKEFPEAQAVYGWVFKSNIASIKIFQKLEFRLVEEKNSMFKFQYHMPGNAN